MGLDQRDGLDAGMVLQHGGEGELHLVAQQPVHHHLGKPGFHRQHELRMVAQKAAQQVVQHRIIEHWRDTEAELSDAVPAHIRSEEHTSELQSLMRISYAVFCLKKKKYEYDINNIT